MNAEELAALEGDNEQRSMRLVDGSLGLRVMLPPGTFELLRITIYLEQLFVDAHERHDAKVLAEQKIAQHLDNLEATIREQVIKQGGIPTGLAQNGVIDLATVADVRRQLDRNHS